ncbi:MAG: hypothetical protein IJF17_02170 [Thermoguttaceae bacterium]|nr:hypothetical protein [Thermoguttaceae bacterium]
MAKRSAKKLSRPFDDDDFNDNDLLDEELDDDDDEFEDDFSDDDDEMEDDSEDEDEEPVSRRRSRKKSVTRRKSLAAEANANKEVRLKAYWSVYTQNFQRVETFEFWEKELAEKKAAELSESKKLPHFVKLDKRVIDG